MSPTTKVTAVPSNVIFFSREFVRRMRSRDDVRSKPSIRQAQAIPQFMSARYFRNGSLTLDDFIDAAMLTTYPADQETARLVAEEIIFGKKKEEVVVSAVEKKKKKSKPTLSALESAIEGIRREIELAQTIRPDKVHEGYEYLQDIKGREDPLLKTSLDYLSEGDIVLRGISSDDELRDVSSDEVRSRFGDLTSQDIANAQTLGMLDEVCDAESFSESLAAKALRGDKDLANEFKRLAARDPATAAKALRFMEELNAPDSETLKELDKTLQQFLRDLSDVAEYTQQLRRLPDNIDQHIQRAPQEYRLSDSTEFTKGLDEHSESDLQEQLLKQYDTQYDEGACRNVDFRQLADASHDSMSWKELVKKETHDTLERSKSRSSPSDFLKQTLKEMSDMQQKIDSKSKQTWQDSMKDLADGAVDSSQTKSQMRQTVRACRRMGVEPSEEAIRESGEKLGMSEEEILELLNPSYEVIKKLIQQGVSSFERLHSLISSAGLSAKQLRELADIADQTENQVALGAIAHVDLMAALGTTSDYGRKRISSDRASKALGGLMGGPATNVIKIWYTYRDELPHELKERLKKIASRLLIDLGMRFAKHTMGTSMLGGIQQSTTVRPFRIGDDIDLIDLEETIDSLLSQGRYSFEVLDAEDFLISETYQGHRAFFWALDKSGSMHSPDKLGMLAISVMAGLYGVQKDDFGVVLFDNETHVVKEIQDRSVSVEKVAADLLEVRASGGTGGAASMKLALKNFEDTRAKEKVFIFSSDAYLGDQHQCEKLAQKFKTQGIKMIVLVPKSSYDLRAAERLAKLSHGVVLDIGAVEELPSRLLRLTNY